MPKAAFPRKEITRVQDIDNNNHYKGTVVSAPRSTSVRVRSGYLAQIHVQVPKAAYGISNLSCQLFSKIRHSVEGLKTHFQLTQPLESFSSLSLQNTMRT